MTIIDGLISAGGGGSNSLQVVDLTQDEYDNLENKDSNTLYRVDNIDIYLGEIPLSYVYMEEEE